MLSRTSATSSVPSKGYESGGLRASSGAHREAVDIGTKRSSPRGEQSSTVVLEGSKTPTDEITWLVDEEDDKIESFDSTISSVRILLLSFNNLCSFSL